ncbi:MAG TPA: serine/threonine-protein kinase [Baekduia sp.]|nr:serine/threonine-protein kinase [Baekduia sp.]
MPRGGRLGTGDLVGDRFRLGQEIGEGGMGRVYEAIDTRHDRAAAVKIISRRLARDAEFRERFAREAHAAEHANHPHILPVWDYGDAGEALYLATPLCDTDLASYIEEHGRLPFAPALELLSQIAWALDWAHNRGVIHRDVKPDNILLVRGVVDVHAYLADFGMARVASAATLTQHGHAPGLSPAYAAPELWEGLPVTPATDQYALAATMFTSLTGTLPFAGSSLATVRRAHLEERPPALPPVGELPQPGAVSDALSVALAKDPAGRFGSCQELMAALRDAAGGAPHSDERHQLPSLSRAPTDPEHPFSAQRSPEESAAPATTTDPPPSPPVPPSRPVATPVGAAMTEIDEQPARPPPEPPEPPEPQVRPSRGRVPVIAAVLAVAVAAVVAVVLLSRSGGSDTPGATTTRVGAVPSDLAAAGHTVWVANQRAGTVSRIDARDGNRTGRDVPTVPQTSKIAADRNGVWAASADGQVQGFDPDTGRPLGPALDLQTTIYDMALSAEALWIADGQGDVIEVPINGQILATPRAPVPVSRSVSALGVGSGRLWALGADGEIVGLDLRNGRIVTRTRSGHRDATELAVTADDTIWVADGPAGQLAAIDGSSGHVKRTVPVPAGRAVGLAAADRTVAYVLLDDGRGVTVDTAAAAVRSLPGVPGRAGSAVLSDGRLWLAYPASSTVASVPIAEGA